MDNKIMNTKTGGNINILFSLSTTVVCAVLVTSVFLARHYTKKGYALKSEIDNYAASKPDYKKLLEQVEYELNAIEFNLDDTMHPDWKLLDGQKSKLLKSQDSLFRRNLILLKEQQQAKSDIQRFADSVQFANKLSLDKAYLDKLK